MQARTLRLRFRLVHLAAAAVMGFCVYAPESEYAWLDRAAEFAVFPLLALTGIGLSQSGRIAAWLHRGSSGSAGTGAVS